MKNQRVVILTPGALASDPRVVKEAQALSGAGYSVVTISTRTMSSVDILDESVVKAATWDCVRLDLRGAWSRRRWRAVQIVRQKWYSLSGRRRSAELSQSWITPALFRAARALPASDLYIAHYPAALPAAASAAELHGSSFAFDAEDFHLGDLPDARENWLIKSIIAAIEEKYLPRAAYVTAASPMIADAYAERHPIQPPLVILNVFPKSNAPSSARPQGTASPGPSLYWFSQTVGEGRGLEAALEAIASAKSAPHLYLRGVPANGYEADLRTLAERLGVADRLHWLPSVAPSELECLGSNYDLGLAGELPRTHNHQLALPNKVFSYLVSGIPIIASNIPSHRRLAPELGEAIALFEANDASGLAAAIDGYLLDRRRLAAARAHAWSLGQSRFNWDLQKAAFLKLVEGVIRK